MMITETNRHTFLRIIYHAVKLPSLLALVALLFYAAAYADFFFEMHFAKNLLALADNVGNFLLSFALTYFIYNFAVMVLWHYQEKIDRQQHLLTIVLTNIRKGLRIVFLLTTINILIVLVSPNGVYLGIANSIIKTIIIGSIGWIAIQFFYTFEAAIYQQMIRLSREEGLKIKALYTKMHIFRNIATVVILIITVAFILMSFSSVKNIGISLLASAGFLTAIAGLAAQKTLFSLFAGLQLALSQMIKIGDTVVIENTTGTIEEITFTYITLKLADKRRLVLPINYFLDKPFQNWSQDGGNFKDTLHLFTDYRMPIQPLRQELDVILKTSTHWDGQVKKLQVGDLHENSVQISIQVSARTPDHLLDLKAEIREKMLTFVNQFYPQYLPKMKLGAI